MEYQEFLTSKKQRIESVGFDINSDIIHPLLFDFQKDIVKWAIKKGRCAVFADTGLGKTFIQLEWGRIIGGNILIFAPLSVSRQTIREAKKINITVNYIRSQDEITSGIFITNYENIESFNNCKNINGIILDESSILKSIDGKTRLKLIKYFKSVKFRLCCTATPAPNDYTELGNHAEFLGICLTAEMLSTYFVNANKTSEIATGNGNGDIIRIKHSNKHGTEWRLRYHAQNDYFRWLSSWAMAIRKPSDLNYDDNGYILPELNINPVITDSDYRPTDELFFSGLKGLKQRADIRKQTIDNKIAEIIKLTQGSEQWIIWCGLDIESKSAKGVLSDSVEVKGTDSPEYKAQCFEDFQDNKIRILITKSKIGGFGMNFQNCHNIIFYGLNDSWESFYQSIRRCYRFGQTKPVNVYIIISDIETAIFENVSKKAEMAERMMNGLINEVKLYEMEELGNEAKKIEYDLNTKEFKSETFEAYLNDSCEKLKEFKDNSIHLSVYSPPFADLYTYSATNRDLGNSKDWQEFFEHYSFIIKELLRLTKPGRMSCVHTSDIPAMQMKDGYIGVRDFPGAVIEAHTKEGWVFYGRAIVTKNPQAQAIRTKAKGLLFTQLRKDSLASRPALLDHILIFKKPGDPEIPVRPVDNKEIDNELWIEWAGGIWTGIHESDTLQYTTARGKDDEKHICPLQLGTIERCIKLYTNPGETVLTPFGGIGSEGYEAVRLGRKAILIELKESYFKILLANMRYIEAKNRQPDLFNPYKDPFDVIDAEVGCLKD
jgi:DNA modification methylase